MSRFRLLAGMGLLSAATLLLQVSLTRVFAIAQFYHFAFLVVSLVLLGFGASGSLLALWPGLRRAALAPWQALGFAVTAALAYLFVNNVPFDSYSIAWDRNQAYLLIANLLGLAIPFAFAGALIGSLLSLHAEEAGRIYGANLLGSAAGSVAAPVIIDALGSERAVLLCVTAGAVAAVVLAARQPWAVGLSAVAVIASLIVLAALPEPLQIQPSPYKRLSQYRLNPDVEITHTDQNAYTRVDTVRSATIHSAAGLSMTYVGGLPEQAGLLIDGDTLLPVINAETAPEGLARALPVSTAYAAREAPEVLMLGSGGGMDAWVALANGAAHVTVVEPNALIYEALTGELRDWAGLADDPRVTLVHEQIRTFVEQAEARYDIVELTLTDNYHPVSSGAFTLTENYALTVEAFRGYLNLLRDDGLFVVTRWLQSPPSEDLRTLALILEALGERDPLQHIIAFRTFQTGTFLVKPTPFSAEEVAILLATLEDMAYDLTLAPTMPEEQINRFARLETPIYHETYLALIHAPDRAAFYASYPFDVSPPTDDHPFFWHFFRWEQTPEVIENLGRRWQPFGGSGYFVLIALLIFTIVAALAFILLPVALRRRFREALMGAGMGRALRALGYFTAIGLAFLFVEVALIQRYILILGEPTLALATVIGSILLFSGLGSLVSDRVPSRYAIALLAVLIAVTPWIAGAATSVLLSLPLAGRVMLTALLIAPVGFLMGMPFPTGIQRLADERDVVPWAWAVNGSASVISAVLAATLALSLGFTAVLLIGGGLYLMAALLATARG